MKIRSITAPNPGAFTLDGTRTYLLGETAVLDPGPDIASHIDAIREAMPKLKMILVTHRHADHVPAAMPLREATGARILAPLELADRRLVGAEVLDIEGTKVEVIATPGHTAEHVCFLTEEGDLFTGDTILGAGTTAIFPPDGNMADYLDSLRLLRSKNPKRIHPAHGPTREDALALIDEYIAHRLEREQQVLAALGSRATTIPELRAAIYPDLDPRLHRAAEIQMSAHLNKLVNEGKVLAEKDAYRLSDFGF